MIRLGKIIGCLIYSKSKPYVLFIFYNFSAIECDLSFFTVVTIFLFLNSSSIGTSSSTMFTVRLLRTCWALWFLLFLFKLGFSNNLLSVEPSFLTFSYILVSFDKRCFKFVNELSKPYLGYKLPNPLKLGLNIFNYEWELYTFVISS